MKDRKFWAEARRESVLLGSIATCVAFALEGKSLFALQDHPWGLILLFAWLFAAILGSGMAVVRHADWLAEALGEPYGTLILTLSVTAIEVMSLTAVMVHGGGDPTLVSATLYSVIMIIMNFMVGVSLLAGAWRYREQIFNLQGANTYLGVIIPLAVLSLVLPNFTVTTAGPTLSRPQTIFLALATAALYATFLFIQTRRHNDYFRLGDADLLDHGAETGHRASAGGIAYHAVLLVIYLAPVIYLAKQFAHPVDYLIETLKQPIGLGGLSMALLVTAPEAIGAVRAARANDLQRAVNIFLGSVLCTIGLTVPVMLMVSMGTGHNLVLGLAGPSMVMLLLTLLVSIITFASGRTNMMQGAVHLILFLTYLQLIFQS